MTDGKAGWLSTALSRWSNNFVGDMVSGKGTLASDVMERTPRTLARHDARKHHHVVSDSPRPVQTEYFKVWVPAMGINFLLCPAFMRVPFIAAVSVVREVWDRGSVRFVLLGSLSVWLSAASPFQPP